MPTWSLDDLRLETPRLLLRVPRLADLAPWAAISVETSFRTVGLRPMAITQSEATANRLATARPMPEVAPVTITTRVLLLFIFVLVLDRLQSAKRALLILTYDGTK